jgi:hypothetical protein
MRVSPNKPFTFVQARKFILSLPKMVKKDFRRFFTGANPLGICFAQYFELSDGYLFSFIYY